MISTVWKIEKLECLKVFENKSNIVHRIYFSLTATLDQFSANYSSTKDLEFDPNAENFIEYESLTEDIVLGWLFSSLGEYRKLELETLVSNKVSAQASSPIEEKALPWKNTDIGIPEVSAPPPPAPATNDVVTELGPVFPELVLDPPPQDPAPSTQENI